MSIIIRLQNLPWSANSIDIRRFFSGQSIPEGGVHIVGGEMGDAFIAFSTDEDARLAMAKDGGKIKDMQIKLLLSSRAEMMRVIEQARQQNMVIVSQPPIVPTQAPAMPLQQPARITPALSEPDRRRERSPVPRHRSRDRSAGRDRRRSPDDRRSSKRDRSRSPSRSSRSFSRDDRRSDRIKRDDRRYDDSRYRDDNRRSSTRDLPVSESKKYSDADHVNSKSQLHATEGFRDIERVYDATQNIPMSSAYQYGSQQLQSQQLQLPSAKNIADLYLHPPSDSASQSPLTDRSIPSKSISAAPAVDQKHALPSLYSQEPVPFRASQFSESSASVSSVGDQQQNKTRRRSRFEPESVSQPNQPSFAVPEIVTKIPEIQNKPSEYSMSRTLRTEYSENRSVWHPGTSISTENTSWNEKLQPLSNSTVSTSGDFLQVVPMDLDPPDSSSELETFTESAPSNISAPYARINDSLRKEDIKRDIQMRGPVMFNSDQNRPSVYNDNQKRSQFMPSDNQNRGPVVHDEDLNRRTLLHNEDLNRRPPIRNEDLNRRPLLHNEDVNRKHPMQNEELNRRPPLLGEDLTRRPPIHNEDLNRRAPLLSEDFNRRPPIHNEDLNRRPPMHNEDLNRRHPMHNEDLNRRPPMHNEDLNRRLPMHNEDLNRRPPMHSEDLNRRAPMHNEELNRPPMHNEDLNRRTPMHNEDLNRRPPMYNNEDLNRRPPMHNEDLNRRPPMLTEDLNRRPSVLTEDLNRRPPMHSEDLNRRPPMHNEELNKRPPLLNEDLNRRPLIHNEDLNRRPLMHNEDLNRRPLMHHEDINRRPLMHNEDLNRRPLMHNEDLNRRPPMHNEDLNRRPPVHNEDVNRRRPVYNDDLSRRPPIHNEDFNRRPLIYNDDLSRRLPMHDEEPNRRFPIRNEELNRGTPMYNEGNSRGPLLRNEDAKRESPMRNDNQNAFSGRHPDNEIRRSPMQNESQSRGPPMHSENKNRNLPVHNENQNKGPLHSENQNRNLPVHNENSNKGPPIHGESQNRGSPMQVDIQNRESMTHGTSQNKGPAENQSRVPSSLTVEVKGLPPDAKIDDVLDLFKGISLPAANIRIEANDKGFEKAFIRFTSSTDFEEALNRNKGFKSEGRCELVPCPAAAFDGARSQKNKPRVKPREEDLTVQLRGLPFSCKEDDIIKFFDGLVILDLFIEKSPDGKASGLGLVEFGSNKDFRTALAMNGKMISHRYITVSVGSKEMLSVYRSENTPKDTPLNEPQPEDGRPPLNQGRPLPLPLQNRPPAPSGRQTPSCIFMKGLPEGVTNRNIADFLNQMQIMPRAIHIMLRPDKMPSGDAYAEFLNPTDMEASLELDGKTLSGNRVEIKPISFFEMSEILGRPVNLPPPEGGLLRTPFSMERPRRPLLPQGPREPIFRERHPVELSMRGGRPRMDPSGRLPFGSSRMRGPWSNNRPRQEGRFPSPSSDRGPKDFGSPGCVVSINNLHFKAGLEEILEFFHGYNITKDNVIRKYNENGQTTGEARVAFQNPRDAQKVVRELNQKPIMGRSLSLSVL